jgi:hypothetical protein
MNGLFWRLYRSLRATPYGMISKRRFGLMPSMPVRSAKRETKPLSVFGVYTRRVLSIVRGFQRLMLKPHVCTGLSGKRSCEYGMRTSAVQPFVTIFAADSHTASQLLSL